MSIRELFKNNLGLCPLCSSLLPIQSVHYVSILGQYIYVCVFILDQVPVGTAARGVQNLLGKSRGHEAI